MISDGWVRYAEIVTRQEPRKKFEVQFGLIKAQSKPKQDLDSLQKVDKAVYGRSETKISSMVSLPKPVAYPWNK